MNDLTSRLQWHAAPSGDSCLVLEFASVLSIEANRQAASASAILNQALHAGALQGITDIVPGMVTVGLHYRPEAIDVPAHTESPYTALLDQVTELLAGQGVSSTCEPRRIEIPVCYGGEQGPDLHEVAQACGISAEALIAQHTGEWLDVLMIGFAPGHPYIGILDPQMSPPRRSTPRTLVPRGSIGLANRQTVIYPVDSPGGWSLIGRSPWRMFNTDKEPPCRLQSGDKVRFFAINAATFDSISAQEYS